MGFCGSRVAEQLGEICRNDTEHGKPSYKRFVQWQEAGLLEQIFHDLGADADLQDISIDSTYIKAHKASAGAAKKGNAIPKTNSKTNASE